MQAIDVLMEEHRVIERVLDALEAGAGRLQRGEAVRPGFFLDVADFAAGFADGCHHHKEEGVLFPAMRESGVPDGGPVDMLLDEHVEGRLYVRQIRDAASALDGGDADAAKRLAAAAHGYAALLRDHIEKEDDAVFPMAAELIPETEHDAVMARFADVERLDTGSDAHARFLELARRLETEAGTA